MTTYLRKFAIISPDNLCHKAKQSCLWVTYRTSNPSRIYIRHRQKKRNWNNNQVSTKTLQCSCNLSLSSVFLCNSWRVSRDQFFAFVVACQNIYFVVTKFLEVLFCDCNVFVVRVTRFVRKCLRVSHWNPSRGTFIYGKKIDIDGP